jgi:hypothetical protein
MKIILITLLVLGGWGAFAQHDHAAPNEEKKAAGINVFKDNKLGAAYEHYLHVKDALVASNKDEARKGAGELQKALAIVPSSTAALDAASKIADASDLSEQRKVFSTLSNEMATLVKGKLSQGALYLEYCPMANNNTGAYWLSNEKEIKNPYFGEMMLKCGMVKETIQ